MNHGKNICRQLKEVRRRIAEENDIPLEIKECTYKGECRGTCPRCEAEVRYLEKSLAERISLGKVAIVAGLALGLAAPGAAVAQDTLPTVLPIHKDTIAKLKFLPPAQSTDVEAYKLQEEETSTVRGESGAVRESSNVIKRRRITVPKDKETQDSLQTEFNKDNGTPARQSISTEQPKMFEEKEENMKIIVK